MKAKTSFEASQYRGMTDSIFQKGSLKDFFQMALEMLSLLCGQVDILGNDFYRRLCDKFLGVSLAFIKGISHLGGGNNFPMEFCCQSLSPILCYDDTGKRFPSTSQLV